MTGPLARIAWLIGGAPLLVAGCSQGLSDDDPTAPDADHGHLPEFPDAEGPGGGNGDSDAFVDEQGTYVLITEVMAQPFNNVGNNRAEYIELWNPTAISFDLSNYYIATSQSYATLPAGETDLDFQQDFIVRFPEGTQIDPQDVVVVAIDGEGFEEAYGEPPNYAIREAGDVSEMRHIEVANLDQIGISGSGEAVVLFHWDGESNLVQDVDMMISGIREGVDHPNNVLDKSGIEVDGPATGVALYREDAATMALVENQFESRADPGHSYTRLAFPGNAIIKEDGNGITGHDVTSEVLRETWESFAEGDEYSPPSPWDLPASLVDEGARSGGE